MKKTKWMILLLAAALLPGSGFSQDSKDIDVDVLKGLQERLHLSPEALALQAALQNGQPGEFFLNRDVLKNHNSHYTIELKTPAVTNQKGTGRCWLYAGLNTLRPKVAERLGLDDFEFSAAYYFFYDKLEKANAFLERILDTVSHPIRDYRVQALLRSPCDDGGYWQNAADLVAKYGAVPMQAMPELAACDNSSPMNRILTLTLRQGAHELRRMAAKKEKAKKLAEHKRRILDRVYRILALHLGEPVQSFPFRYKLKKDKDDGDKGDKKDKGSTWTEYKTYTPQEFAREFIQEDMGEYLMFANWPGRPYGKFYAVEYSSNLVSGTPLRFVNLPMEEIKAMILASLKAGEPVNFSADVGKMLDRGRGIMHPEMYRYNEAYGVDLSMDKARDSQLCNINSTHAMVFTGVDLTEGKPLKWKVENSWGDKNGAKGFYAMYDGWMDLYVVRVVLHKQFVSAKTLDLFKTKPVLIPFTEPEQ